jgi:heptaprenyl diphosphate synthase
MKKWDKFSMVAVSVAGGICHNLGQVLMAILLLGVKELAYYMIVLTISGTVAGIVVGLSGALLLKYTQRIKFS